MPSFNQTIRPYVSAELTEAWCALRRGEPAVSFILNGPMFWANHRHSITPRSSKHAGLGAAHPRSSRSGRGQLLRIVGAATRSPFDLVPTGNTAGSNVSPAKPLPIPADLAESIASARQIAQRKV
jgi:hypothetical protein